MSVKKWRSRLIRAPPSLLGDIHDGVITKQFLSSNEFNYLSSLFCYLLTLNVDWFQPFERNMYSLGAIYLTIQNLPRSLRYKLENILLVGIMPGLKEASSNINSYLGPLVQELEEAWKYGFSLINAHQVPITVRLALSCIACYIPASRKVSGFLFVTQHLLVAISVIRSLMQALVSLVTTQDLAEITGDFVQGSFIDNIFKKY